MSSIFYKVGYLSSSYPWLAVIFCVTLTSLLGMGMYNLKLESEPENLWVSHSSRTYKEQEKFANNFGSFFLTDQMMLLSKNEEETNIFTKEGLSVIYFLQQIIDNIGVMNQDQEITLDDLCYKPVSGKGCLKPSPMDVWLQDPSLLKEDDDIQFTTLCTESVDINRTNIPCSDTNGIPVIREAIFAGITCQERQNDTQPCDHCYIKAKSLVVTYLLNNNKYTQDNAKLWELEVYMKTIQEFNNVDNNNTSYKWLVEQYNKQLESQQYPALDFEILQKYKAVYLSGRSISDELVTETNQNIWIVGLSYLMMFLYISVALGQFPSKIYSTFLLGSGGILIVTAALISSLGLVSYLNISLTMISAEVIPFLILAIGVDNMFIIMHTMERVKAADSLQDQMGITLEQVGPSITTAAICETLTFLVGAYTKMPALQSFCIQAAFGVFLDYIFQLTVFVAFLTWDQVRKQQKRYDCLFCLENPDYPDGSDRKWVRKVIKNYYNPLLKTLPCRIVTGVIFIALFIISIFGCIKLQNGLEEQVGLVSDSDLFNYFTYEKRLIEIGPPAYLVLDGFDYNNKQDLQTIQDLSNALSQNNQTVQPPIYSWVQSFNLYRDNNAEWTKTCGTADILLDDFPTQLRRFVNTKITSACCQRYGICGETFQADIVLDDNGLPKVTRLRFQHRPIHTSEEYILTFEQTRQVIDNLASNFQQNRTALAYSLPYIFYDQYQYIRGIAIQNVFLGLATIFLTVVVIQDYICALIVTVTVFIITFNLIGLVWLLNVIFGGFVIQINAISVVNMVTCIGLGVEFCAHIVQKFRVANGTLQERADMAMMTMGNSVFIGIACTKFIGVIVLAFALSTLFKLYYFRMYFLMIIAGTFNGLCVLPIVLAIAGPQTQIKGSRYSKINMDNSEQSQSQTSSFMSRAKLVNK